MKHLFALFVIAVPGICIADEGAVYNHVSGARTALDDAVHKHFAKRYAVVDVTDKEHSWQSPRGAKPTPPMPLYRDGTCVPGHALVALVIGADGAVHDAFAVQSSSDFVAAVAVAQAKERRFTSAQLDGRQVASLAASNVRFVCPPDGK